MPSTTLPRPILGSVAPLTATTLSDEDRASRTAELFAELETCTDDTRRRAIAADIVSVNLQVADAIARRYAHRGLSIEDLTQEARLALVKVVQSFRPELGHTFLVYAVPSILGTLRKQFRDTSWGVRPPRRVQEARQAINQVRPELIQELAREPTIAELTEHLDLDEETVVEALCADDCYKPASLDRQLTGDHTSGERTLGSCLGFRDHELELCEIRVVLRPLVASLPERDQEVLHMRFFEGLTQREIGDRIGVSQMQVSRILSRIFDVLRDGLGAVPLAPTG